MKKYLILFLFTTISFAQQKTFSNPILPSGADPYSTYYKGYYYYTNTLGNRLVLWKTKDLSELKNAESKVIWEAQKGTNYAAGIWAPEFHIINGKWYCYFAADNGENKNNRI